MLSALPTTHRIGFDGQSRILDGIHTHGMHTNHTATSTKTSTTPTTTTTKIKQQQHCPTTNTRDGRGGGGVEVEGFISYPLSDGRGRALHPTHTHTHTHRNLNSFIQHFYGMCACVGEGGGCAMQDPVEKSRVKELQDAFAAQRLAEQSK